MSDTTTPKNSSEDIENTNKKKKTDLSLVDRAIREFIKDRLLGQDWGTNLQNIMVSKWKGLSKEFLKFTQWHKDFGSASKEQREIFENVPAQRFLQETFEIKTTFESKQWALKHVLQEEYEGISPEMQKEYFDRVDKLSLSELTHYLRNSLERHKFVNSSLPNAPIKKKDFLSFLKDLNIRNSTLTDEQKQAIIDVRDLNHVDEEQVAHLLKLFIWSSLEQKQLLIRAFLPTISLGKLVDMGIIVEAEAYEVIRKKVDKNEMFTEFRDLVEAHPEMIRQIDLNEIIIPTKLFPEDVVDKIITTEGVKQIKNELNELFDDVKKEVQDEGWEIDKNGSYKTDLIKKINSIKGPDGKKSKIENAENISEVGSVIHGKIRKGDKIEDIYIRIDAFHEDNQNATGKKTVDITHLQTPGGGVSRNSTASRMEQNVRFDDLVELFGALESGKVFTKEVFNKKVEDRDIIEVLEGDKIQTLQELNDRLNSFDRTWEEFSLKKWEKTTFSIFTPGEPGYGIFSVSDVNEDAQTLRVYNGVKDLWLLTFSEFVERFEANNGARISSLNNTDSLLGALQKHSKNSKEYGKIDIKDGKLIPRDRRDDPKFQWLKYFAWKDGNLIEVLEIKWDKIKLSFHEGFEQKKEADKDGKEYMKETSKYVTTPEWYGLEIFYQQHEKFECKPKISEKTIEPEKEVKIPERGNSGFMKHMLSGYSLANLIDWGKQLIDFVKHKLDHHSKINAAKLALAMGKWMGLKGDWLTDLRGTVHTNTKKLIDELVTELTGLPSKIRQDRIKSILTNHGSHDYEVIAGITAMLQKHGTLYTGELKAFEGTFAWYKALWGGTNDGFMMKIKQDCLKKGEPFSEEVLIREYLKALGWKDGNYKIDWNLWVQCVKKPWAEWIQNETKTGTDEGAKFQSAAGRMNYAYSKFEDKEYAHGIWALETVWGKGGTIAEMNEGAFMLAISDIPEHLAKEQLKGLRDKFLSWHPYPGLLFLGSKADQDLFRTVVKKLCEANPEMEKAYTKIENLIRSDPDKKLVRTIREFWWEYGDTLSKKLLITQDPEILARKEEDADIKAYHNTLSELTGWVKTLDKEEVENDGYIYEKSSLIWANPNHLLSSFLKINPAQALIETNDPATKQVWESVISAMAAVKNITWKTEEEKRHLQFATYMFYHKAITKLFNDRFRDAVYENDLPKQAYIKDLEAKSGFTIPRYNIKYESSEYKEHVKKDFDNYMSDRITARVETEKVPLSVADIIGWNK